jgi:hypothetical protein
MFSNRVSSSLTPLFGKAVPYVVTVFNVVFILASVFVFPRKYIDFYIGFSLFSFVMSTLAIYWSRVLREVYFNSTYLFIGVGADKMKIPLRDIQSVYRFLTCFVIRYSNGNNANQNVILLPDFIESITTLGLVAPASIRTLRQAIFAAKQFTNE